MSARTSGAGLTGAVIVGSLVVLPSLVPRAGVIQGLLMGTCAAIGYGLGCGAWALSRRAQPRPRWWLLIVAMFALVAGWRWQGELARVTGVEGPAPTWIVVAATVASLTFAVLLWAARGVRWLTRRLGSALRRMMSPRLATAGAVTTSAVVLLVAVDRLPDALVSSLGPLFARANASTPAGLAPPTSAYVSGGPGSAIPWQDLGSQGKAFVSGVTAQSELRAFSGMPARAPIRAFVGTDSAATAQQRAQLAVEELERFGAFERRVIAVGTSAGSGTVDPGEVAPLEYLLDGDVATVSTQYSLLPSFLSFLVDRPDSEEAARTLLAAVRERAAQEPQPPRIVVFGESLGAYGSSSFPDLGAALELVEGSIWDVQTY